MNKYFAIAIIALSTLLAFSCSLASNSANAGKPIKSAPAGNNLTVTMSNADGVLRKGDQNFTVAFADASGKPVDVGAVAVNFFMPAMGSMSAIQRCRRGAASTSLTYLRFAMSGCRSPSTVACPPLAMAKMSWKPAAGTGSQNFVHAVSEARTAKVHARIRKGPRSTFCTRPSCTRC